MAGLCGVVMKTLLSAVNADYFTNENFTTRPYKRALIDAEYEQLRRDHLFLGLPAGCCFQLSHEVSCMNANKSKR